MTKSNSLARHALVGSIWTTGGTFIGLTLQTGQLFILARLLPPSDFGIAAIALFAVLLGQNFLDLGIGNSLIVAKELPPERVHTAFWMNLVAGLGVAALVLGAAVPVARFYALPLLVPMLLLNGAALAAQAPSVHYKSLLQRAQRFRVLSGIEVLTASLAAVVNIALVWAGVGVVAFAYSMLLKSLLMSGLMIYKGRDLYTPRRIYDRSEARKLMHSGMYLVGNASISTLANSSDTLLLSKLLGPAALGVVDVAKNLILRPLLLIGPTVVRVGIPMMATMTHEPERLRSAMLRALEISLLMSIPIYLVMGTLSPAVVRVLFGAKWLAAVPVLQILSLMGLLRTFLTPYVATMLALNHTRIIFLTNLLNVVVGLTLVVVGAFFLQEIGVAWALVAQGVVYWLAMVFFLLPRYVGIPAGAFLGRLPRFLLVIALVTPFGFALQFLLPTYHWQFWLGGPLLLVAYLGTAYLILPVSKQLLRALKE